MTKEKILQVSAALLEEKIPFKLIAPGAPSLQTIEVVYCRDLELLTRIAQECDLRLEFAQGTLTFLDKPGTPR